MGCLRVLSKRDAANGEHEAEYVNRRALRACSWGVGWWQGWVAASD